MRTDKPLMLVEDDMVDAMTVKRAFKDLKINVPLIVAQNGEEAIHILEEGGEKPALILLDLNMPVMNGVEFLRRAKASPEWRQIPVVILTTSQEQEDKQECFNLSAAGYMTKPVGYPNFVELMKAVDQYWTHSEFA